jgi:hypothetical protein
MPMPVYASANPRSDGLYVGTLVTYIVGMFTFVPHLVSIILSFVMVGKGYVHGGRKAVGISPHPTPHPLPLPSKKETN